MDVAILTEGDLWAWTMFGVNLTRPRDSTVHTVPGWMVGEQGSFQPCGDPASAEGPRIRPEQTSDGRGRGVRCSSPHQ